MGPETDVTTGPVRHRAVDRRAFLVGALGLVSTAGARARATGDSIESYAQRLGGGLAQTGGGRFVGSTEQALHAAHQRVRLAHGLPELTLHPGLALAARAHAADQSLRGYFDHVSPEGFGPSERVGLLARTFVGLPGENIIETEGRYLGPDPELLMTSWMESPGHRDNILRRDFTHLGLGAVQAGRRTVVVASFGQRFAELAEPLPSAVSPEALAGLLQTAQPAIYSYDLSRVGREERSGAFDGAAAPDGYAGAFSLRPRLQEGRDITIVFGPIVELNG